MPILDQRSLDFLSHSPEQTMRFGVRLGERLEPGDIICLSGELGAGKTTFVAGAARGWGTPDVVTSPTFVLVNEYRRADQRRLYHLDCYRLHSAVEVLTIGFEDLLNGEAAMLIEWPERIREVIPPEHLQISLRWVEDMKRGLRFEARGARYDQLAEEFRRAAFGG